jgi:hypothetical protein
MTTATHCPSRLTGYLSPYPAVANVMKGDGDDRQQAQCPEWPQEWHGHR